MTAPDGFEKAIVVGIVEAQSLFAPFLSEMLVEGGFEVAFSRESIERGDIATYRPDVLLIDIDFLPGNIISELRSLRNTSPDSTICAYTGTVDEQWAASCCRAGANCVISKLATPVEVVSGILRAVRVGSFIDTRFDSMSDT